MKRSFAPTVLLLLLASAAPSVALAADPPKGSDPAAAQSLFYEARALMGQGKYALACPKLEESMRLDPGIGTQFNLADCNEHIGKIATAWASFLDVAAQSKASNQPEREKVARKRAQALESKLPKLVVDVPAATPGLEVKRDGIVVGAAAFGTSIPVDPGAHHITATAPGKQTWETNVHATEGRTARVSVPRDLPAAPVAAAAVPVPVGPPAAAPVQTVRTDATAMDNTYFPPPVTEERGSTQRTLGWIVAGAGVVGLGVGAGFGLSSLSSRDESREHCTRDACNSTGVALRDDAIRAGNVSTVATIAGGAALVGGIVLVLTAPKGTERAERSGSLRAAPNVATNGGGFMLQGSFR